MVLEHVPQNSGLVKIAGTVFHSDGFGCRDLDVVDVVGIPDRLKNHVGKAQQKDVLDGFLAEVVVNAVNLFFVQVLTQALVKLLGAGQVKAKRLFKDHMSPTFGVSLVQQSG